MHRSVNLPFPKTITDKLRKKKNCIPVASRNLFIKSVGLVTVRQAFILALGSFVLLSSLSHRYFQSGNSSFMEPDLRDYLIQSKLPWDLGDLHKLTFSITLQQITSGSVCKVAEQSQGQTSYS